MTNVIDYNIILYASIISNDDLFDTVFNKKYTSKINPGYIYPGLWSKHTLIFQALTYKKYSFVFFVIYHFEPKLYLNKKFMDLLLEHLINCNNEKYNICKKQKETLLKISKIIIKNYLYLCPIMIRSINKIYKNNLIKYFYEINPEFIKNKSNIIIDKILQYENKNYINEINNFYSLLNNDIEFPSECFNLLCNKNRFECVEYLLSKYDVNDLKIKKYVNIFKLQRFVNLIISNNKSTINKYINEYVDYVNFNNDDNKICKNYIVLQNLSKNKKETELNILLDTIKDKQYFIINSSNKARLGLLFLFCKHNLSLNLITKLVNKIGDKCYPGIFIEGTNSLLTSISNKNHEVVMYLLNTFGEKCYCC